MTHDLNLLIADAAPLVPDSGPSRRMSRTLLHEKMRQSADIKRSRDRLGKSLVVALVFMVVFSGQVTELGSDGFDYTTRIENDEGIGPRLLVRSPLAGPEVSFPADTSPEFVANYRQGIAAGEQTPVRLYGWRIDGKSFWMTEQVLMIQDEIKFLGQIPRNLIGHKSETSSTIMKFVAGPAEEFLELVEIQKISGKRFKLIEAEGLVFDVYSWTRPWPGFGEVTYYTGAPVSSADLTR